MGNTSATSTLTRTTLRDMPSHLASHVVTVGVAFVAVIAAAVVVAFAIYIDLGFSMLLIVPMDLKTNCVMDLRFYS